MFDEVNPVGAAGKVVTARTADAAEVPPAFVAVTVKL